MYVAIIDPNNTNIILSKKLPSKIWKDTAYATDNNITENTASIIDALGSPSALLSALNSSISLNLYINEYPCTEVIRNKIKNNINV